MRLIFIAPGWGKFDLGWYFFKKYFTKKGFDVVYVEYPQSGFVKIEESAQVVKEKLQSLRPYYEHITFVGHSMGGLIGRHLIQNEDNIGCDNRLFDSYISLGSPHRGTILGHLGFWSDSAAQMRPSSAFIQGLNKKAWPSEIPAMSISGGMDWIVLIPKKSAAPGIKGWRHERIHSATHSSLILHPRVAHEIWAWLIYELFNEVGFQNRVGLFSKIKEKIKNNG